MHEIRILNCTKIEPSPFGMTFDAEVVSSKELNFLFNLAQHTVASGPSQGLKIWGAVVGIIYFPRL